MKKYIKNFVFFIISSIIITLVLSSTISGSNSLVSIDKNIYLTDKSIEKEIILYNFFNDTLEYTVNLYTSPFSSEISQKNIVLQPNESKKITFTINPVKNSLKEVYTASVEVVTKNNTVVEYFTITQEFNKKCDIDIQASQKYLENNNYSLSIFFNNTNDENKSVVLRNISLIPDFSEKVITINSNSVYEYTVNFTSKEKDLNLEYICNSILINENIILKKEINIKNYSGYFSLNNLNTILESIYFKIFLIFILILVVISFSVRYIKYVSKH